MVIKGCLFCQKRYVKYMAIPRRGVESGVNIYGDAKHRGIYLALFTDPEGDSCFSIYQIGWIKMKKVTFCNLKASLSRDFFFLIYKHFGDFVKCIFTILLQSQHENNLLPTSKHRKAKVRRFLGICLYDLWLKFCLSKMSRNEMPSWLWSQNR